MSYKVAITMVEGSSKAAVVVVVVVVVGCYRVALSFLGLALLPSLLCLSL